MIGKINTRVKGNTLVLRCKKILEERGWTVDSCEKKQRFVKGSRDLFGLFDLIALHRGEVMFIQITSENPHPHKNYVQFIATYGPFLEVGVQQWIWKKRKGFTVYTYSWDSYTKRIL